MTAKVGGPRIRFHYLKGRGSLRTTARLKKTLLRLFKQEKRKLESLSIIFCSDPYLKKINQAYLKHDYYTDIISFDYSDPGQALVADIFISIDRVRKNAIRFRTKPTRELHRVILHGALHFCGYKDKTPRQTKKIRQKEEEYLVHLRPVPRGTK